MYEHNALGYWSGLALCLTKIRSSRARCPATALILFGSQAKLPAPFSRTSVRQYRTAPSAVCDILIIPTHHF